MRGLKEVLGRFFKEDPRAEKLGGLVSTFRGQIESLLGEKDTREFSLTQEETQRLTGPWERPATAEIKRRKKGLRVDIYSQNIGEAIELKGNRLRFLETAGSVGRYWEAPKPGDLGAEISRMQDWIRYITVLEGLQKNPQTASSAPIVP